MQVLLPSSSLPPAAPVGKGWQEHLAARAAVMAGAHPGPPMQVGIPLEPAMPGQPRRFPAAGTTPACPRRYNPLPGNATGQGPSPQWSGESHHRRVLHALAGGCLPSVGEVGSCTPHAWGILCRGATRCLQARRLFLSARSPSPPAPLCSPPAMPSMSCVASKSKSSITSGSCRGRREPRGSPAGGRR